MKKLAKWVVEQEGIRPAGDPNKCLYCKQPKGSEHLPDCVIRRRTVVVKMTFEVVLETPEYTTPDQIEFHINDSSSCIDNIVERMSEQRERWQAIRDKEGSSPCFCSRAKGEYLREATEDDEAWAALRVESFKG